MRRTFALSIPFESPSRPPLKGRCKTQLFKLIEMKKPPFRTCPGQLEADRDGFRGL